MRYQKIVFLAFIVLALSACETTTRLKIDYRSSSSQAPLEIPPDLNKLPSDSLEFGENTYSAYAAERAALKSGAGDLLPKFKNIEIRRDGDIRWLRIKADKNSLWIDTKNFLGDLGLAIESENRSTGIINTNWAENRASLGSGGGMFANVIRRFESTGERDRYRVRMESDTPGWFEVYISHQGMIEIKATGTSNIDYYHWERRPSDHELEAEMLKLLMVYLGVEDKKANTLLASGIRKARAILAKDKNTSQPYIIVKAPNGRTLRRLEVTLDRLGAEVIASEEGGSILTIMYLLPKDEQVKDAGFFGRLFKGGNKMPRQYKIQVIDAGDQTELRILDKKGKADMSARAENLLKILFDQLR